jgi:GxxExxY protein
MHPLYSKAHALSKEAIGAAIEVHREIGPGLIESYYERSLMHELGLRQLICTSQKKVPFRYKGLEIDEPLRFDILADDCLLIEGKAVETILPIHKAQLMTYMKLLNVPIGLLINFHETLLKNGIHRLILPGANQP